MRPLKLKIEGLKSISEKQTIDFEKLSQNGIFGIFGKTGSGKSTVLDAIVLAIYGEVIENLKGSDFINVGCDFAAVELDFSVKLNGKTQVYKAERVYKYNKARTLVTSSAKLCRLDEKGDYVCIAENALNVTSLLKNEIIGLEKSDFLKCIALPQGDFAAFVKMTRTERLSVIGKLFDLTKYGDELAQKVKRRERDLTLENERLNGKLEALCCPDEKVVKADEAAISELALSAEKNKSETATAEKDLLVAKSLENLVHERKEKSADLKQKSAYKPVIEQKRQKLKAFERVKIVKQTLLTYEKTKAEKAQSDKKLGDLTKRKNAAAETFENAKKQKELLPALSEKTVELKVKLQTATGLKTKNIELESKKQRREQLRNDYIAIVNEVKVKQKQKELFEEKANELKIKIEKVNVSGVLEKLKSNLSAAVVSEFCKNEIEFLQKVLAGLDKGKQSESAVYGLIAAHIEKLSAQITEEKVSADGLINECAEALKTASELSGELVKAQSVAEKLNAEISGLNKNAELITAEGGKVRAEYDALSEEIKSVLNGKNYDEAVKDFNAELEKTAKTEKQITENFEKAAEIQNAVKSELAAETALNEKLTVMLSESEKTLTAELAPLGLEVAAAREILNYPEAENDEKLVSSYDESVKTLENRLGELNKKIAEYDEKYLDYAAFYEKVANLKKNLEEINKKHSELSVKHKNDLKNLTERCIIVERTAEVGKKLELLGRLYEIVRAGRFMEFIADEYLKEIAGEAETRVLELTSGRYGLVYDGNFFVTDNFAGGIKRPVAGLSGGETFIVSLSLALALSKQISAKALRPIDFFFLDEGFGTLDEDLVDDVCDSLEKLRMANFTVGLITHVTELKNRIASKLYVHGATAAKGTEIEIVY